MKWMLSAAVLSGCLTLACGAERVDMAWTFAKAGDLLGWLPNGHITEQSVANGAIRGYCTGSDPFLHSPIFDIPASPDQSVEITMTSDKAGSGQLFWTNTTEGQYEGFSQDRSVSFPIPEADTPQVVRIRPYWQAAKKIIRIRIDLGGGEHFAISQIRVVGRETGAVTTDRAWQFQTGAGAWTPEGLTVKSAGNDGVTLVVDRNDNWLHAPNLALAAGNANFVNVTMKADRPGNATLAFAADQVDGLRQMRFPLRDDGRFHTYAVAIGADAGWQGNVVALALRPVAEPGAQVVLSSIQLTQEPIGPPDLELGYFGVAEAMPRSGRPTLVVAQVINRGPETAKGVTAKVTAPAGVTVKPLDTKPLELDYEVPAEFRFEVTADKPAELKLSVTGPGAPVAGAAATIKPTPAPNLPKASYVPAPVPAKWKYRVGSYYFPGWYDASRWEPVQRVAPQRKPVLGWYDESNPEIIDWQIKWAVEHGVSFFLVDWYWSAGNTHLMHWLEGFDKAKYRDQLDWAIMWANHNAPNTHSKEDWIKVTQFWIDHYLKMPNYLQVDGKPAVYIWAPYNIRRDLGGSPQAAELLAISQQMAKQAGLPGITFIAMNAGNSLGEAQTLKAEGYVGNATYHWWADAMSVAADAGHFPFSLVAERSKAGWEQRREWLTEAGLFYQPTADTGWDSRPWHGDKARVISDRTTADFTKILRDAKSYLDAHNENFLILGPWNEWGEGSYIEPNQEYGFEMLDAVHDVFCEPGPKPLDIVPSDIGLGPYDLPPRPAGRTAWDFENTTDGWSRMMGVTNLHQEGGALVFTTDTTDPALASPPLNALAREYPYVAIRLAAGPGEGGDGLQLFFSTATAAVSENTSVKLPLILDGQPHDYLFDMRSNPRWMGLVRGFRLDVGSQKGVTLRIDSIRMLREKP